MDAVTLIAPPSVAGWYPALGGDPALMRVIGENDPVDARDLAHRIAALGGAAARIHSGHDSLRRDRDLADALERHGIRTSVQSLTAVTAGVDKVFAREALTRAGVPLTPWGTGAAPTGADVLVKARDSTQSRDIAWASSEPLPDGTYWEKWVDGLEYSVVGYRDAGTTILPIISKGATRRDLLPPWQRARTVSPRVTPPGSAEMIEATRTTVEALDVWGFFEVEFVVAGTVACAVQVIEVNPRISGTLRLAAMAAGVPIFAPGALAGDRTIPAALVGIEVPYGGAPVASDRLIATSRLTCVGETIDEIRTRVAGLAPELGAEIDRIPFGDA